MPPKDKVLAQLAFLNEQISKLTDELAQIDDNISNNPDMSKIIESRHKAVDRRLQALIKLKKTLDQAKTNKSIGFNNQQQRIVNEINNEFHEKYSKQIENLKKMTNLQKREFFTTYDKADSLVLKDIYLKSFFKTR